VFLDQTGLTIPILFVFFTTMSFLEGKDDITADFLEKFPVTFAVGTVLYPSIIAIKAPLILIVQEVIFYADKAKNRR
jgi:hypothetical protein